MQGPRDPRPRQAAPRTVPARRRMQSGTCPPLPWTALGHRQRGKRPRFCRQNLLKVLHSGRERCWVVQEGTVQWLPAAVRSVASEGQGARPRAPRGAVWAREGGGVPGTGPPSPRKELTVRENRAARPPDGPAMTRWAAPGRAHRRGRDGVGAAACERLASLPPRGHVSLILRFYLPAPARVLRRRLLAAHRPALRAPTCGPHGARGARDRLRVPRTRVGGLRATSGREGLDRGLSQSLRASLVLEILVFLNSEGTCLSGAGDRVQAAGVHGPLPGPRGVASSGGCWRESRTPLLSAPGPLPKSNSSLFSSLLACCGG